MSGFAGFVSAESAAPDRRLLEQMAAGLAFRGPDGTHIWAQPGAGFCFTFLRTGPAPQCATQPCSLDGRVWLLGDVRLDGREDLRRELEGAGESLAPEVTDEELVLRAWRLRGEGCLPDLMGDFSFALWDAEARRLVCVRDLIGARPFFYTRAGAWLYFSNTLNSLLLPPDLSSALDPQFIGDFLLWEWSPGTGRTVYRDIQRLPPGHILKYSSGQLAVRRYTSLPIEEPLWLKREEEYVEQFQALLDTAVLDRLPRGAATIFMSGGLDSPSIASAVKAAANDKGLPLNLRAYTIDCRPVLNKDEEGDYASLVAQSLGIPIEILPGASVLPYRGAEDPSLRTPEPCHDPFLSQNRWQYTQLSRHAHVAFSGYGGDDILKGQAWPYLVYLLRRRRLGTLLRVFGTYILRHRRFPPLRAGFRRRIARFVGRTDVMTDYPKWINPRFEEEQQLAHRWRELQRRQDSAHPLHPIGYAGLTSEFWSSMFELEDAGWTGVAIEVRAPFLDLRLLRYLLRLPPVPWCMGKQLLRDAARDRLPEVVRRRPKTPLAGDLLERFVETSTWNPLPLPEPVAEIHGFVDWEKLKFILPKATGPALLGALRPVSLHYWLKGIEKDGRIR